MHMEEIDFCWRLKRQGFRVVCEPASHVYHIGGASLKPGSSEKVFLNYRNNLLALYKNLAPNEWRRVLFSRILLDAAGMLRSFLLLRPGEAAAVFRAYLAAQRMKKHFVGERPKVGEQSVVLPYRGNVVFDYFLLGRRHFSELPVGKFEK